MTTAPGGPDGTAPAHDHWREQLGALVLGGLDDRERAAVEAHLASCPACRAERDALTPLAGPLSRVDPARVDPDAVAGSGPGTDGPPPAGFADLLARLDAERDRPADPLHVPATDVPATDVPEPGAAPRRVTPIRRRRGVSALVAAAAVVVVGLAGVGVGYAVGTLGDPPVEPVAVQALDPAVRATAGTIDHTWGVEMVLTASGFAEGQTYQVTVLDRAGRTVPAGAFRGTGPAEMVCRLNTSVLRDDAGGFVVTDADGDEVLRSRFT